VNGKSRLPGKRTVRKKTKVGCKGRETGYHRVLFIEEREKKNEGRERLKREHYHIKKIQAARRL